MAARGRRIEHRELRRDEVLEEDSEAIVDVADDVDVAPVRLGRDHQPEAAGQAVDLRQIRRGSHTVRIGLAVDARLDEVEQAPEGRARRVGVAPEDGERVAVAARSEDVAAVARDCDRGHAIEPGDSAEPFAPAVQPGEQPGRRIATEDRDGVVELPRHIEVQSVRREGKRGGAVQPVDRWIAGRVAHLAEVGQLAAQSVAREDRDGRVHGRGGVEMEPIGREEERPRLEQSVERSAAGQRLAVDQRREVGELARAGVAGEALERVAELRRSVEVQPVRTDRESRRPVERRPAAIGQGRVGRAGRCRRRGRRPQSGLRGIPPCRGAVRPG